METVPFSGRRRRGYNRLSPPHRRSLKVAKFGGSRRSWRLRMGAPKLRLIRLAASPLRLWYRLKNAYMNMMLRVRLGSAPEFGGKRIPEARASPVAYSRSEFENRLVFEIYKSMVASFELGYSKKP
ncbi:uncharacterized protein LOC127258056 [Andrographis paniculata]|uniref:uncharacterized protein LOC127258056 n=1 Tax=Andrographis paniculata TaxID=175694 RepID=UPI0021E7AFA0|nr:uncharacterized protein LOC127258056 [Andrographis paniculata]